MFYLLKCSTRFLQFCSLCPVKEKPRWKRSHKESNRHFSDVFMNAAWFLFPLQLLQAESIQPIVRHSYYFHSFLSNVNSLLIRLLIQNPPSLLWGPHPGMRFHITIRGAANNHGHRNEIITQANELIGGELPCKTSLLIKNSYQCGPWWR